jgi:hypothetical protein
MIYIRTELRMSSSSGSLVVTNEPTIEKCYRSTTKFLFLIFYSYLDISLIFFEVLLLQNIIVL